MEKSKEYVAYLVARGHSPKRVKQTFKKMTKTEAKVTKQKAINKNTIIFPAEYNPRGPVVNAIIMRHEHISQHNSVLKELFPRDSFIVTNKRAKNLSE